VSDERSHRDEEERAAELWEQATEALLRRGAGFLEAFDGATLIVQEYRHRRREQAERATAVGSLRVFARLASGGESNHDDREERTEKAIQHVSTS
jgi:hypothetical protein